MRRVMSRPATIAAQLDEPERKVISSAISENRVERPATALELADRIEGLSRDAAKSGGQDAVKRS